MTTLLFLAERLAPPTSGAYFAQHERIGWYFATFEQTLLVKKALPGYSGISHDLAYQLDGRAGSRPRPDCRAAAHVGRDVTPPYRLLAYYS